MTRLIDDLREADRELHGALEVARSPEIKNGLEQAIACTTELIRLWHAGVRGEDFRLEMTDAISFAKDKIKSSGNPKKCIKP